LAFALPLNTVCNRLVFKQPWWDKLFGDGYDDESGHHPSKYFAGWEPGMYVVVALGMCFGVMLDWNLFFYIDGITNAQFTNSLAARAADQSPSAWFSPGAVILACNAVTGALVGLGKVAIEEVATNFATIRDRIMKLFHKQED
jgi:hypothetical protein